MLLSKFAGRRRGVVSITNIVLLAVPLAILTLGVLGYFYYKAQQETPPPLDFLLQVQRSLTGDSKLSSDFIDANSDLVADAPIKADEFVDPETLVFGVLGPDVEKEQERWGDFIVVLEQTTGKKIQLESMETNATTLAEVNSKASLGRTSDLRAGKLHIVSMNTGAVPLYVNEGGVVPVCVMAKDDGSFGYKMELIVPAKSSIATVNDLKGHRFTFASLHSHSGFHAPLVTLWKEFNLRPERDYSPVFAGNQELIIQLVGKGEIGAAAVASDLLQRLEARGDIKQSDYRSLYQSTTFPPACYGYSHRLSPALADKVKAAFLEFNFAGTSLEKAYGPAGQTKFVPIDYREHWASVRETNEFVGTLLNNVKNAAKKN